MIKEKNELGVAEREKLTEDFWDEMGNYSPDWDKIIKMNRPTGNYAPAEIQKMTVEPFCNALKHLREKRQLTLKEMGERLSYTKQYISRIEHCAIKNIPINKLELISGCFSVSIAYLIGIIDDDSCEPDLAQYYFWEHPDCKYLPIKDEVIHKPLIYPIEFCGKPLENLIKELEQKIGNDYELALALNTILDLKNLKRKKLITIIKNLSQIL